MVAGLWRSGSAEGGGVPDDLILSLREVARLRARWMRERHDYLRQLVGKLDVVFPEHRTAGRRECRAAPCRMASALSPKDGTGQDGQARVDCRRREVAPYRVRDAHAPGTL